MSNPSANLTLIQCGFPECRHSCNRDYSHYPPDRTPLDRIAIRIDNRRRAMLCSGCDRYTIYVCSQVEAEQKIEQYKSK